MKPELHVKVRLEDGAFWATVDEYPGVFATGETADELRESLQEGISLYLAEPGQEPPHIELIDFAFESAETSATAGLAYA